MMDAFERLLQGNQRFATGRASAADTSTTRRMQIAKHQQPFALVLSCSDSRVPPEIIFDCGLGDLFVIRNAGHVIDQSVIESIVFGIQILQIPLILVLGHTHCGAINLVLQRERENGDGDSSYLYEQLRPAIKQCKNGEELLACVLKAHIRTTVARLKDLMINFDRQVKIAGGYYDLESGIVKVV